MSTTHRTAPLKRLIESAVPGAWGSEPIGEGADAICIRVADFVRERFEAREGDEPTLRFIDPQTRERLALVPDDVLLERSGDTGYPARYVGEAGATYSNFLLRLRPASDVDPRYLWYALQWGYLSGIAASHTNRTTMSNLDVGAYLSARMPVWPLASQRAIAEYLDRETSRIDALIGARQRMIELLEERWEAFRVASVSGATSQSERARSGLRWLGSVPNDWSVERLKFLARMESGHTPDKKVEAYWVDCTIPWITLNDVGLLEHEWTITQPINAINELGMANSAAHILPEGTIVLSRDATVGRSAILGRPMTVSQHFVGWIPGPRLMPEYLLHVLRGPMQRHFATLTAGATIATIGMPKLNDLVVPVPPIDDQKRIIAELRLAENRFNRARRALDTQVGLLQERRQSLITAAVTGQFDIPEAA